MKKLLTCLVLATSLFGAYSASAAQYKLEGDDAVEMLNLLVANRMTRTSDVTLEFASAQDIKCVGENFVDHCVGRPADWRPAAPMQTIDEHTTSTLWHLLRKAGVENVTDAHGEATISVSRIDCETQTVGENSCTITTP